MKDLNQIIDQLQDKMNELLDRWLRIPRRKSPARLSARRPAKC